MNRVFDEAQRIESNELASVREARPWGSEWNGVKAESGSLEGLSAQKL